MDTYDIKIKYSGKSLDNNTIPVRDLGPSLLALSELFTNIQDMSNNLDEKISLNVKATSKGSFIIDMALATDFFHKAVSLLNSDRSNAILALTTYGTTFIGLIKFIQFVGKRKLKKQEKVERDTIKITLDDESTIIIPTKSLEAYQNVTVRKNARDMIAPLKEDGIDSMEIYHEKSQTITITKNDYDKFEVPEVKESNLDTTVNEVYLQIINVAFEHGKWKFSSGSNTFFANITDEQFLKTVEKNLDQFGSTDLLKVKLQTRQYLDKDQIIKSEYTVQKVLDHHKGSQQIKLDFTDEKETSSN
ncbi:hypothetical protein [Companilactobacillus zhongbaensis]|uniref:hypothetical protein n=1 Tax=Companilactobacillus zhongbaensis TaxID=2486009 RepID=UPI000F776923|nr:hypothetical protein [Companilactobacillus zhongbaensis]